jgi:hypothetical protein
MDNCHAIVGGAMEASKLRVKVGQHEFEAEGDPESVKAQFEAFQQILGMLDGRKALVVPDDVNETPPPDTPPPPKTPHVVSFVPLDRIMRVQGRVVSLTVPPSAIEDAALLILLGNNQLRNNETVTGGEVGDALAQSGRPVARVDRIMEKMIEEAFVLKSGFKRATRYRLSNTGQQKALSVAKDLIATLP